MSDPVRSVFRFLQSEGVAFVRGAGEVLDPTESADLIARALQAIPSPLPEPELGEGGAPGRVTTEGGDPHFCFLECDADPRHHPAPAQDPIQDLAVSIAIVEAAGHAPAWTGSQIDDAAARWEARLRSAFPAVSSLLGELAIKTEALEEAFRVGGDLGRKPVDALLRSLDIMKAALAPGSGRLAGEVLRAVRDCRLDTECKTHRQFAVHLRRIMEADAALDAAHPEMRQEAPDGE